MRRQVGITSVTGERPDIVGSARHERIFGVDKMVVSPLLLLTFTLRIPLPPALPFPLPRPLPYSVIPLLSLTL